MGAFDAASGALLGSMGLKLDLPAGEAEIGYWTVPEARGRGVATRAGRALAGWALDGLGIRRLVWRAVLGNHASRLAALRIGVQIEGVQRARLRAPGGGFVDGWVGSLLSGDVLTATPDWLAPGSAAARQAATFAGDQPRLPLPAGGPAGSLRPMSPRDASARLATLQDQETVRWASAPVAGYTQEQLAAGDRKAQRLWLLGEGAQFVVADERDECVGLAGLGIYTARQLPDTAEIGFSIAPHARNRGYATAALRSMAEWGIDALGLARIVWRARVGNEASRRVAEKAGFTYEGIARTAWKQRDEHRDVWVASLVATDLSPTRLSPTKTMSR
jgi:RimJ/RimL family protein N-acetyltransferase